MNLNDYKYCQDFTREIVELFGDSNVLFRSIFDSCRRTDRFLQGLKSKVEAKNILEIGTFTGVTAAFIALLHSKASVTTIDIASKVLHYTESDRRKVWEATGTIDQIKAFVGDNETKKKLITEHGPFDLAFVDGDHSYEGVLYDYECLKGNLTSDAIILFDDTLNKCLGVDRFVEEFIPVEAILSNRDHCAIVDNLILGI